MEQDLFKEINKIVNEVCKKFQYDSTDKEWNDSLRTVLIKVCSVMLKDANEEDRNLFYEMLRHTPIVVTENLTREGLKQLEEQYIGNINPHILDQEIDLGEYSKNVGAGAYVSEPILDENLQLKGKKSFLYIQRVSEKMQHFFGTDINVSHLIHELGHAWHAEKDEYTMLPNNILKERVGTADVKKKDELLHSVSDIRLSEFNKGIKDVRSAVLQKHTRDTGEKGESR